MKQHNILFVDDEQHVINALKRSLRATPYNKFFALSGKEALALLEHTPIDLIVSDMRMPEMDGYEFLSIVREKYPDIPSIILSGYTDKDIVYKSLLKGVAKAYISKPWDNAELIAYIQRILFTKEKLQAAHLVQLILPGEKLPVIADSYNAIVEKIEAEASTDEIVSLISQDPVLTANILQIANSAFYGRRVLTSNVRDAIVYLGRHVIRDIVMSLGILNAMEFTQECMEDFEILWKNTHEMNRMFHFLYKKIAGKSVPDEIHSAALLCNIGLFYLYSFYPEKVTQLKSQVNGKICLSLGKERALLGTDHDAISGYLLDWWNFPYAMVECAVHHGSLESLDEQMPLHILLLNFIEYEIYKGIAVMDREISEDFYQLLPIEREEFESLIDEYNSL